MGIEIKKFTQYENPECFKQYSEVVEKITEKTDQAKRKYGVEDAEMSSFSPDLLPTNEHPMMLSEAVYADYQRVFELTNQNNVEYNFLWLGNKKELAGREYYSIEKAIELPQASALEQSSANPIDKIKLYDSIDGHDGYNVIIDGHSHPKLDPSYGDFDKLPDALLEDLSLGSPGENYSLSDLAHYSSLLGGRSEIKEKTIIGAVITFTGELLNVVSDPKDESVIPTTIREVMADTDANVITLPTSSYDEEKSKQFFGE